MAPALVVMVMMLLVMMRRRKRMVMVMDTGIPALSQLYTVHPKVSGSPPSAFTKSWYMSPLEQTKCR